MPVALTTSHSARNSPSASILTCDDLAEALPYDPASQVTQILHQLTATSATINQAGYLYNAMGNRTSLTDRRGPQAFGYDNLDRLTSASHPLLPTPQAFAYDPVGNRTTGGSVVNAGNQLTADATHSYQYDDNGNLTRKTLLATGHYTQYTYDAENRLTKVEDFVAGNPTPAATSTYRYDGLGRRIEKMANGQTKRHVYDGEDILLEYDGSNVLQARYTHGHGIDEPLSRTPMVPGVGSGHTDVLASTPDEVTGPVVDDGIRVNGQVSIGFVFVSGPPTPALGQPITATGSHVPVPLIDVTTASATGTVTVDLIDTGRIGGNAPLYLVVRDIATSQVVTSTLLFPARTTFASTTPIGTPMVVASTTLPVTTALASVFYHQDGLGTVTDLTDATGATAKSYAYDAYGTILESPGMLDQPYTYTGREFDSESGLYYLRARSFDPIAGRFFQKDPIGLRGGLNLYRYAFDNPVRFTDPRGTDVWMGAEASGIVMAGIGGFQGGGGAIINVATGERCGFTLTCGRVGVGLILGAGGKGLGQLFAPRCGKDVGGWSVALAGDIIVPGFSGIGGSVGGGGGLGVGAAVGPDVGAGIAAGIDFCYVKIQGCVNTPPDCQDCSKSK